MFKCDSADLCAGKKNQVLMGGLAKGQACGDPGAVTPIGASGILYFISLTCDNLQLSIPGIIIYHFPGNSVWIEVILMGRGDNRYWILMYYGNWNVNFEFSNEILPHFCITKDNSRILNYPSLAIYCLKLYWLELNAWVWLGCGWSELYNTIFHFSDTQKDYAKLSLVLHTYQFLYTTL